MNPTLSLWYKKRVKVCCGKERNMIPKDSYNFFEGVSKCVKDIDYFFNRTRNRSDRQWYLFDTICFTSTSGHTYRSRERNSTLDQLDRLVRRLYFVRVSLKLLITLRTQSFPWRGAHENIDKRRSNRGELVKGEEDICRSIDWPWEDGRIYTRGRTKEERCREEDVKGALRAGPLPSSFVPERGHRVRKGEPP